MRKEVQALAVAILPGDQEPFILNFPWTQRTASYVTSSLS